MAEYGDFTFIPDDPRTGGTDPDTWFAVPDLDNPAGARHGGWCVFAGDYPDDPDIVITVQAECPKDVAAFIVTAVRNEIERSSSQTHILSHVAAEVDRG